MAISRSRPSGDSESNRNMSTEPINNFRKITTVPRHDARKVKVGNEDGEGQLPGRICSLGSSKICHYLTPQRGYGAHIFASLNVVFLLRLHFIPSFEYFVVSTKILT